MRLKINLRPALPYWISADKPHASTYSFQADTFGHSALCEKLDRGSPWDPDVKVAVSPHFYLLALARDGTCSNCQLLQGRYFPTMADFKLLLYERCR